MADLPRYPLPNENTAAIGTTAANVPPNILAGIGPGIQAGATLGFQSRQTAALEQERQTQLMQAQATAQIAQQTQERELTKLALDKLSDPLLPGDYKNRLASQIQPLMDKTFGQHGLTPDFSSHDFNEPDKDMQNILGDYKKTLDGQMPLSTLKVRAQSLAAKHTGNKYLEEQLNKMVSGATEDQKHQDELEQQAKQQQMSIRGDAVIKQLETQRNAAGQVYDIMKRSQDKNGNYNLTRPQLLDQYANVYRAQSGMGITGEALPMMDQPTAEGNYSKLAAYFGLAKNALPKELGDRLLLMTRQLGEFSEAQHAKMMESRLTPNTGLAPERAAKLSKEDIRGFTFQEMADKADKESKYQPQGQKFPANWSAEKIKRYQQWKANAK